jgi:hypothetical protein
MSRKPRSTQVDTVETLLDQLTRWAAELQTLAPSLTAQRPSVVRRALDATALLRECVDLVEATLDPVRLPDAVFDPANPLALAHAISLRLRDCPSEPLSALSARYGSGIYALYYCGSLRAYRAIAGDEYPIYVGKAEPREFDAMTPRAQGPALSVRLEEHRKSIHRVESFAERAGVEPTLRVADFRCRALVLDSAWQGVAENLLIRTYRPVWNKETGICFGFGKHGDSPEVRGNRRSAWDTLHPGRAWATRAGNVQGRRTAAEISARIESHCAHYRSGRWWRDLTPA